MNIAARTRSSYSLDDFRPGDVIALSTLALGDEKLDGIMYARVTCVSHDTGKLFLRNDTYKCDFTAPVHFVSHKMFFDG